MKALRMAHKLFRIKRVFNQIDGFSYCIDAVVAESVLLIALCEFSTLVIFICFLFFGKLIHRIEFGDNFELENF